VCIKIYATRPAAALAHSASRGLLQATGPRGRARPRGPAGWRIGCGLGVGAARCGGSGALARVPLVRGGACRWDRWHREVAGGPARETGKGTVSDGEGDKSEAGGGWGMDGA
jgi:hypothetical protein